MVIRARLTVDGLSKPFECSFNTKEEAEKFIKEHPAIKGKKPTNYKVEYIEEYSYNVKNKLRALRIERNKILCATDWLMLPDVKLDQRHRKMYIEYRSYLRDLPNNYRDGNEISVEMFEHWLRRKYPQEYMDGGDSKKIISMFNSYIKQEE